MIAPESSLKDAPNVFKNDWSSVKEVEEALARQKAKEKAERDEKARLKKLKEEADAKKTQAEREADAAKEKADLETQAKIDEAIRKQGEADAKAATATEKLNTVSKDLADYKRWYNTLEKRLERYEEDVPVKASTFNAKPVWLLPYSPWESGKPDALAMPTYDITIAPFDKTSNTQLVSLELVDNNQPAGPWFVRIYGNYLEMLGGDDGQPVLFEESDRTDGHLMKVITSGSRQSGDRGKGQEWFIVLRKGYYFIMNNRFTGHSLGYSRGCQIWACKIAKKENYSNWIGWDIVLKT